MENLQQNSNNPEENQVQQPINQAPETVYPTEQPLVQDSFVQQQANDPQPGDLLMQKNLKRISSGRSSILLIAILSVINIATYLLNADFTFPFSLTLPYFFLGFGEGFGDVVNSSAPVLIGAGIGVLLSGLFLAMYFVSKTRIWAIVVSLVVFSFDTLCLFIFLFIGYVANPEFDFSVIIDIAFHAWALASIALLLSAALSSRKQSMAQFPRSF